MAHSTNRTRARQVVETLERPEGISPTKWRGVKATLLAIADFYPKAYPSQRILAEKVGCDLRTIQRYVALARANGLLLVKADAGVKGRNNTWSKTNQYHIINTTESRLSLTTECRPKPSGTTYPPVKELRSSPSSKEKSLSAAAISRQDPEGPTRQVGPKAKLPAPPKTPAQRKKARDLIVASGYQSGDIKPPKSTPWRRTAARFLTEWDSMVTATTPGDHLRAVRPAETMGHFQSYLQANFYGQSAATPKTEEEVAALIAQFMTDVFRRQIKIKNGQSAWMCFTGAWGRNTARTAHGSVSALEEYRKGVSQ